MIVMREEKLGRNGDAMMSLNPLGVKNDAIRMGLRKCEFFENGYALIGGGRTVKANDERSMNDRRGVS
jgi:hypothetical protein